jgi:hypothetical protein
MWTSHPRGGGVSGPFVYPAWQHAPTVSKIAEPTSVLWTGNRPEAVDTAITKDERNPAIPLEKWPICRL